MGRTEVELVAAGSTRLRFLTLDTLPCHRLPHARLIAPNSYSLPSPSPSKSILQRAFNFTPSPHTSHDLGDSTPFANGRTHQSRLTRCRASPIKKCLVCPYGTHSGGLPHFYFHSFSIIINLSSICAATRMTILPRTTFMLSPANLRRGGWLPRISI
jgi:hypothetical protein